MKSNQITEKLLKIYSSLYSKEDAPKDMFKLCPAIPFVGNKYQNTEPKILSYASAENLSYAYDKKLQPNTAKIHKLEAKEQFNRAKYFFNNSNGYFPYVHMAPFNNGSQLFITRHICNKLGYVNIFKNNPYEFIEQISVANPGKFSIADIKNIDYASDKEKMSFSIKYIKSDFEQLKPEIVILPKTVFRTINKIEKWENILNEANIKNVKFVQIMQLSFFNNFRVKKQIEKLPVADKGNYLYGEWLEKIDCEKVDINAHFSWIDNKLYEITNIKSS